MSSGATSEPPLSLPPEMLRELASAGVEADQAPSLEQWQTLLLRFAHRFREEPTNPLQFAASALGHDLRTPMTVVIGASELLLEGTLDPEQRLAAQNVHRSGQQLLNVIDQMLSDVTEHGKSTPPPRVLTPPLGFRLGAETEVHRVLLAEDNEFNRMLIERVLRTLNCEVDLAPTGREAVRKFQQNKYDLVLMDCHMPDLDGLEATRQIRAAEGPNRRVPILAITAGTVPGVRQACLQAGMDDFIAKPFSLSTLRRKSSRWLAMAAPEPSGKREERSPVESAQRQQREASAANVVVSVHASVDLSRLQELAEEAGSPRIVEELSLIFVEDMERRLESLCEATAERGERKLLSVIHSVKGACGNFGALRMAALSEKIEKRIKRGDLLSLDLEVNELCEEFQVVRRVLDLEVFGIRADDPPTSLSHQLIGP
ncbi:MAG TPA: response regulator [Polyangiaceae bacterium]|nr:response regulator [Polyangiaceae bacterium]